MFYTKFFVGTETEFILLKSTVPPVPVNSQGWCASGALMTGAVETQVLEEIAKALIDDGIELQVFHSEAVNGQVDINLAPGVTLQLIILCSVRGRHWTPSTARGGRCIDTYSGNHL